jgi:excinuclease ABC subunit B
MKSFSIQVPFEPKGDQPTVMVYDRPDVIAQLTDYVTAGHRFQTLLGETGTGKTHAIASL